MSSADEAPDYPPGPRGPEDQEPGVRLDLGPDQLAWVQRLVEKTPGTSNVQIEDRGAGYFRVTLTRDGKVLEERTVFPIIGQFTEP
jgi:hypothetical protein